MKTTSITCLCLVLLGEISALCFVKETVTVKKTVLKQPPVVDEYHCKILCAEMDTCLSYIHQFGHCAMLGGKVEASLMCTLPNKEMVKKTNDKDCKVPFSTQPIEKEYIRNPATATGTIVSMNTASGQPCGTDIVVIDVTLPDNSHILLGNTKSTNLTWDDKLGTWMLKEDQKTIYLRAAQCISPASTGLVSTASCGGVVSQCKIVKSGYSTPSAIQVYGVAGACPKAKDTLWLRWSDEGALQRYGPGIETRVMCLYGAWFVYYAFSKDTPLITSAVCALKSGSG